MKSSTSNLPEVIRFTAQWTGTERSAIHASNGLEEDLGITGDDADEFMTEFARRFQVDLRGFEFSRHFGSEASFTPLPAIIGLFAGSGRESITMERLA